MNRTALCGLCALAATSLFRERFTAAGTEPQASTPEQLRLRIAQEIPRSEKLPAQLVRRSR